MSRGARAALLLALAGLTAMGARGAWGSATSAGLEATREVAVEAATGAAAQEPEQGPRVVDWSAASEHLGERVTVTGTIVDTHNSGRVVFLNYDRDWRGKFRLVVFPDAWPQFPEPPEDLFRDKGVRVTGTARRGSDLEVSGLRGGVSWRAKVLAGSDAAA